MSWRLRKSGSVITPPRSKMAASNCRSVEPRGGTEWELVISLHCAATRGAGARRAPIRLWRLGLEPSIGLAPKRPAALVHQLVMERAERAEVGDARHPKLSPELQMMTDGPLNRTVTWGKDAAFVADQERATNGGWDGAPRATNIQGLSGGVQRDR